MKDLFDKSAFGGVVHIYADNGELMMLANEQHFAEFMAATMSPIAMQPSATHPHVAKLAQGGVPVYGDNGEHKANLNERHLSEYLNATGVRHDSHNFEPQQAWHKRFSPDF